MHSPQSYIKYFILIIGVLFSTFIKGQDFSNKGHEFWALFPPHCPSGGNLANLSLYITSDANTSGKIIINGVEAPFEIVAYEPKEFVLDRSTTYVSGFESANDADITKIVQNKGIRILVDDGKPDIVVYAHMYANARSAASIILPTSVLERKYEAISYTQSANVIESGETRRSQFSVIAVEDNTRIQVQLRKNGEKYGSPYFVDLPKAGTIYSYQDNNDITGSSIEAVSSNQTNGKNCKKIAVFSGSSGLSIGNSPGTVSFDPLFQQCYPINTWGSNFFITPFKNKNKYIIRILAKDNLTEVNVGGVIYPLEAGEFTELRFENSSAFYISSNNPICVAQYSYTQSGDIGVGDPDMVILNPVEQNINDVTVFQTYKKSITQQYVNVVIKDEGVESFTINGAKPNSSFIKIANSKYSYLQESFSVNSSFLSLRLKSDSGFNAFCYGFGSFESYMYSAGTNVIDPYQTLSVNNQYAIETNPITCKGSPFKASITLPYKPFSINWKVENYNDFLINSPFPIDSSILNGKKIFKYNLDSYIIYNTIGTFNFKVQVVTPPSPDGCSGEQEINFKLKVIAPPAGNFNLITSNCIQDSITLSDNTPIGDKPVYKYFWNFGDGKFIDTIKNVKFKPNSEGTFKVRYVVANTIGCLSDTISKTIKIDSAINVNYSISKFTCQNKDVELIDLSKSRGAAIMQNWIWDYGDGSKLDTITSNAKVKHQYSQLQTYTSSLIVQTVNGCSSSNSVSVIIHPNPQIAVKLPEVCLEDASAKFIDQTTIADNTSNQFSYLWNFNDSTFKTFPDPVLLSSNATKVKNPEVKYKFPGKYIVSLRVLQDQTGCVDSARLSFTVNGSIPKPLFYVLKDTALCSNEFVEIRDSSWVDIGSIGKLNIEWGDGTDSTVDDPTLNKIYKHLYKNITAPSSLNLNYKVKVNASSGIVCQAAVTNTLSIVPPPEDPVITTLKDYLCKSDTLVLHTLSKGGAPPFINAWTSENANATIRDSVIKGIITGQVQTSLIVTDQKKCHYTYSNLPFFNTMIVRDIPIATIAAVDTIICNGDAITLTAQGDNPVTYFTWYRNDTLLNQTPVGSIVQNLPGRYKVTVNDGKCNSILSEAVKISALNITKYNFSHKLKICIGVPFAVTTSAVDQYNVHYKWDFGDGFNYLKASPGSHKYISKGSYSIKLNVTNDYCPKYDYQVIGSPIKVEAAVTPSTYKFFFIAKQPFRLVTKTDPGYVLYTWDPITFLDKPNQPNPIFMGDQSTDYTLTRTDTATSCTVTDEYEIIVSTQIFVNLPNAFTPNNDGLNDVLKVEYSAGIGSDFNYRIFNRWGKLLFQTKDINKGWDGRDPNGILQEMDAYNYFLEYNYIDPLTQKLETVKKTGSVILFR
jgi:gliding motility-associated-like protein